MFSENNPPTEAQYVSTLKELGPGLTDTQLRILRIHYSSSGHALTSQELSRALGYEGKIAPSNGAYGKLGRLVGSHFGFSVDDRKENRPDWWRALATSDGSGEHSMWIMRPELASALELTGLVKADESGLIRAPDIDLNTTDESTALEGSALEGRKKLVRHFRRERKGALVDQKKTQAKTLDCEICGFDSFAFYGVAYCEAHHLTPIAMLEEGSETTLDNLALVCAACHRIIHSKTPPHSLEEVTAMISSNGQNKRMESNV